MKDRDGNRLQVGDILTYWTLNHHGIRIQREGVTVRIVDIEQFPLTEIATLQWRGGQHDGEEFQLNTQMLLNSNWVKQE